MKIGIDMDEVIAGLLPEYINFLNNNYGLELSIERFNGYYTWDTWDNTFEYKMELFEEFYKSEFFRNVKPTLKSIEVINKIKSGNELFVVTSRPENIQEETKGWIEKFFPDTFSGVYFIDYSIKNKKSDICKDLNITVMVEDSLDHARDCANNNISSILIDYPWNREEVSHNLIQRVGSLEMLTTVAPFKG
jgi:uncharacterized HAD superfamily protein